MGMNASADLVYGIDLEDFDAPHELYEKYDAVGCGLCDVIGEMGLDGVDTALYGGFDNYKNILCTRREYGFDCSPTEVDIDKLQGPYKEDEVKLKEACEALGLDFADYEPKWYLCASYM